MNTDVEQHTSPQMVQLQLLQIQEQQSEHQKVEVQELPHKDDFFSWEDNSTRTSRFVFETLDLVKQTSYHISYSVSWTESSIIYNTSFYNGNYSTYEHWYFL